MTLRRITSPMRNCTMRKVPTMQTIPQPVPRSREVIMPMMIPARMDRMILSIWSNPLLFAALALFLALFPGELGEPLFAVLLLFRNRSGAAEQAAEGAGRRTFRQRSP